MSEYGGSGGDHHGPVYVDMFGTGRRMGLEVQPSKHPKGPHGFSAPHPDGPLWLRGLRGQLPLWLAFWGGFFFGHGLLIAFSVGTMLVAVVIGMTVDPRNLGDSYSTAASIMVPIGIVAVLFAAWSSVTVWRSARHATRPKWGIVARGIILVYFSIWVFAAVKAFS